MNMTKFFYAAKKSVSEHSPEILLVSGIVGFVGTVVLACKATTKASEILEHHKEEMESVNNLVEDPTLDGEDTGYTLTDAKKDKTIIFAQTCVSFVKLYGPSIVTGALSITCFLASYKIIHGRYVAAMSLAAGLSETLNAYRKRVVEELGREMDDHFLNGTTVEKIKVTQIDENGKQKKVDANLVSVDQSNIPIYSKFFDESNVNWSKSPSTNLMFLSGQQARANDLFRIRGYLFLNDVYHLIGLPATDIGNMVGWFENHGDQFVDFGLYEDSERKRAFVNGFEPSILLNFNCVPKMEGDLLKY